jgi:hypothetical protein
MLQTRKKSSTSRTLDNIPAMAHAPDETRHYAALNAWIRLFTEPGVQEDDDTMTRLTTRQAQLKALIDASS